MEAGGGACAAARSYWLAVTSLISSLSLLFSNTRVLSRFMDYLTAILFFQHLHFHALVQSESNLNRNALKGKKCLNPLNFVKMTQNCRS